MDTPPHLVHVTLDSDGRLDSLTISAQWREKLGGSGPRLSAEVLMAVWRATPWPSQPSIRSFEPGWMANAGALARGDFVDRAVRALDAAMAGAGQSTTRELTTDRGEIWAFVGALKVGLGLLTALEAVEASGAVIGLSVVWLLQRSWSR